VTNRFAGLRHATARRVLCISWSVSADTNVVYT
jgi:hypothetical protein